jgi:AcrR family transcriptional regulator
MPPRVNVTSNQILEAAFALTREQGYESVNARSIAKRIGCSTQPIFSRFTSMDELKHAFHTYLGEYFTGYVMQRMVGENPFRQVGIAYIAFAKEEPNLFRVLFMSDIQKLDGFTGFFGDADNVEVATQLSKGLGISFKAAKRLYMKSWIFAHGIASMIATNSIQLSDGDIQEMLGSSYRAFLVQETTDKEVDG